MTRRAHLCGPLEDLLREQDLGMLAPELGNCVRRRQRAFHAGRLCADAAIVAGGGGPAWLAQWPLSPVDNGPARAPHLPPARGAFSVRGDHVVTSIRVGLAQERP